MSDGAPLLERAFFRPDEVADEAAVDGPLPDHLRGGTLYLNGPAVFARGEVRYRHWLDGDGLVAALRFGDAGATFTCRFVRSTKFVAEEEAGRALYRAFGTRFPGDRLKRGLGLESPVNVSVYPFAGHLLAFGEQGLPWELDPVTLETRGEHTFDGALNAVSPFSAHPCFDYASGEMLSFGIAFGAAEPVLHLYRFAPDGTLARRSRLALPYPCSLHDFGLGPRHAVFYLNPYILDAGAMLRDGSTAMEALSWQPERGSFLLVLDRATGSEVARVPVGNRYCLHQIDAFEQDGRLVVDLVELDRPVYDQYEVLPDLFTAVAPGRPARYEVDVERGAVVAKSDLPYDRAPDFPSLDTRRALRGYRHLWLLGIGPTGRPGRKFFDQLVHLDWREPAGVDLWTAPPACYLAGQPVLAGDPAADETGTLLCPLFDAQRVASSVLLFDARRVAAGPYATVRLPRPVPPLFHACWA